MKRHYVTIEVTVHAEDDEDAIRKSEKETENKIQI